MRWHMGFVVGGAQAEACPSHGVHGNVMVFAAGNDFKSLLLNLQKPTARNSQGEGCPVQIKASFMGSRCLLMLQGGHSFISFHL